MTSYPLTDPEARFLYEKAGFAAYSAYRAFELEIDDRFEDAKQEAVLTFWKLYEQKGSEEYAFVGAKYSVMNFLKTKGPYRCLSLDVGRDDYDCPWTERLVVPQNGNGTNGDWLDEAQPGRPQDRRQVPPTARPSSGDRRPARDGPADGLEL
jgi:hypothetical protein